MIQFPETAATEWQIVADAANAETELRDRLVHDSKVVYETEKMRIRHEASLALQAELDTDLTPVLEMMTVDNYVTNPNTGVHDMIEGVMKHNGTTLVLGPSGSGKSTVALQICHSLMSGDDWLGQKVTKISGAVGVLSYDMDGSMVADWMAGFPNVDLSKISVVNAHKRGNPLGVPAMRAQIAAKWRAAKTEVVVIDSFSASFFGQDQNDAAATMHYYRDMKLFALTECEAKALIVIVHSTDSNPDKARGSTVQHDTADSIIGVSIGDNAKRRVKMVKYRQHRDPATGAMTSQMSPIMVGKPDDITHLVDIDTGAMVMAGMHLPSGFSSMAFTDMPDPDTAPDTSDDPADDDDEDVTL